MVARVRRITGAVFLVAVAALPLGGCGGGEKKPGDPPAVASAVLPVMTGGIVAAQAASRLATPFAQVASRLRAWAECAAAQTGTVCARTIDPSQELVPQLADALKNAGLAGGDTAAAMGAWTGGTRERFREARTLLAEAAKHAPPGMGNFGTDPGGEYGVVVFKNGSRTILVLADIRSCTTADAAWLIELDYHVSNSYVAGLSIYHVTSGPAPVLTVQVYSWISQVEGMFGAVARGMAEGELRAQAEATWRDVAAYLGGGGSPRP
jgi:hypothetical protein